MKYFVYAFLAFMSCVLFLPKAGSMEIRNVPILISVIALITIYGLYRLVQIGIPMYRIGSILKKRGMKIRKIRLYFRKGYIISENEKEAYNISLLTRKRSYYRYHFDSENKIEFYKSTVAVNKSSGGGRIARGAVNQRLVGKQKISRPTFSTDKTVHHFIVINKFPYRITDSAKKEELDNGVRICLSDVLLFDLKGFMRFADN